MVSIKSLNPNDNPMHVNIMDQKGLTQSVAEAATDNTTGYITRREPAVVDALGYVLVAACELMGRDIGRYVRFVRRFGAEDESANVVIAELRQVYMTGDQVSLTLGAGGVAEYSFAPGDKLAVYGDRVEIADILADHTLVDHRGTKKK